MSNLPVPAGAQSAQLEQQPAQGPAPYFAEGEGKLHVWTSLSLPENAGLVVSAMQGGNALSIGDNLGVEIDIEHIVAHRVTVVDDDGVVEDADRFILITPEGHFYAATSNGMRNALQVLMAFYGLPPWRPALRVRLAQVNTRRGRRTFTLTPVQDTAGETPRPATGAAAKSKGK